jgi:hypothetical protein
MDTSAKAIGSGSQRRNGACGDQTSQDLEACVPVGLRNGFGSLHQAVNTPSRSSGIAPWLSAQRGHAIRACHRTRRSSVSARPAPTARRQDRQDRLFCIGSVVAGESGGTSRWSHGLGYFFSARRRDGLIPDKLSLNLSALLRPLNLFLKLRV